MFSYLLAVILAVWFVWLGHDKPMEDGMFYLFAATIVMIRAEGRRIRDAIEARK